MALNGSVRSTMRTLSGWRRKNTAESASSGVSSPTACSTRTTHCSSTRGHSISTCSCTPTPSLATWSGKFRVYGIIARIRIPVVAGVCYFHIPLIFLYLYLWQQMKDLSDQSSNSVPENCKYHHYENRKNDLHHVIDTVGYSLFIVCHHP